MEEIWKEVLGYEGLYQISNIGLVKSVSNNRNRKEKILKVGINTGGYYQVVLNKNSKGKTIQIHKLVAMAFLNHKPDGHKIVVDNINNIKTDNRLENLQLISNRENCSKDKKGSSKYVGVYWDKKANKWKSQIYINGKVKHLGLFNYELLAHESYKIALNQLKKN